MKKSKVFLSLFLTLAIVMSGINLTAFNSSAEDVAPETEEVETSAVMTAASDTSANPTAVTLSEDEPVVATGTSSTIKASGTFGTDKAFTWTLYDDGELVIAGDGDPGEFSSASAVPWYRNSPLVKKVTIASTVRPANMKYWFYRCAALVTAPVIPNSVTNMSSAFNGCTSLTIAPEIPNSVTNMNQTFYGCTSLTEAPIIPDSVTSMGGTFCNCTSLTIVPEIPNSVTNMDSTFYGCTSLTKAPVISSSVTNMNSAFYGCTSLTTAPEIPNSVTNMYYTFNGCTSLIGVIIICAAPSKYTSCFNGAATNGTLTVHYTNDNADVIDAIIATKSETSNIVKGQNIQTEISSVSVSTGDANTKIVTVFTSNATPTHYCISETETMPEDAWTELKDNTFAVTKNGTYYLWVKNSYDYVSDPYEFTVTGIKTKVSELDFTGSNAIYVGMQDDIGLYYEGEPKSIAFETELNDVVAFDEEEMMLTGLKYGTFTITAIATNYDGTTETAVLEGTCYNTEPVITAQPTAQTTTLEDEVTFSVEVEGSALSYQWYIADNSIAEGSAINKATGSSYTIPLESLNQELDGKYFYCIISNEGNEPVETKHVRLNVANRPNAPTFELNLQYNSWVNRELQISLTGSKILDSTENVGYKYSLDSGLTWIDYTDAFVWNLDTVKTVILAKAYNKTYPTVTSEESSLIVKYDATKPEINHVSVTDKSVKIAATDATSGVSAYGLSASPTAEPTVWSDSDTVEAATYGIAYAWARDAAGNTACYATPINVVCEHASTEVRNAKEVSCTEDGYTGDTYCIDCETTVVTGNVIPATGHQHTSTTEENRVEATCTEDGSYDEVITCTDCDAEISRTQKVIAATGHTGGTPDENGNAVCDTCGESYITHVEAHEGTVIKNAIDATCTTNGYSGDVYCAICNHLLESGTVINATGHQHTEIHDAVAATCTENGYTGDTFCTDCQTVIATGTDIPATGHHPITTAEEENHVDATCTDDGCYEIVIYCADCDEELERTLYVIPATGHTTELRNKKDATCGTDGYTGDTYCTKCDSVVTKGKVIKATGNHAWDSGKVTKAATTKATGIKTYTCKHCGAIKTETIAKLKETVKKQYTLRFDGNKGKSSKASIKLKEGSKYGTLPKATRKGYAFKGWYTKKSGGTKVSSKTVCKKNVILYAQWTKVSVKKETVKSLKSKSGKLTVTYNKVSGAKGYQVAYATDKAFKKATVKTTNKTTYTSAKLKKGKTYYVRVRAYSIDSTGKKVYGAWSTSKKVVIK